VQRDVAAGRWDWQVLAAPGHDPLSVALYQPELGVLISADALWENGFGVVFPELVGEPGFDDVRRTLESFAALDVRCVIPGHGRAFTDVRGALERAFRRVDAFVQDPHRHAEHAAKVLLKFRLLETQAETWDSLARWMQSATYFELLRSRYFPALGLTEWLRLLADDLAARGALSVSTDRVANILSQDI